MLILGLENAVDFGSAQSARFVYHDLSILMFVRTTLNLRDDLLEEARRLTGIREKTELVHKGLAELIAAESARRLALLGGTMPKLRPFRRKRPKW